MTFSSLHSIYDIENVLLITRKPYEMEKLTLITPVIALHRDTSERTEKDTEILFELILLDSVCIRSFKINISIQKTLIITNLIKNLLLSQT